jgi:hypothetical protein
MLCAYSPDLLQFGVEVDDLNSVRPATCGCGSTCVECANDPAPSADRIVCRGRAGEHVAPPRASVLDGRQPTERGVEAAAVGGPATRQGGVWIRIASSRSNRRTWPAHCLLCQFGLARLVSAGRRAELATPGDRREGPLGPTLAGPSAAAAPCWERDTRQSASASGARTVGGAATYRLRRCCTALSGGRLSGPQDCEAAPHAWRRRARKRPLSGTTPSSGPAKSPRAHRRGDHLPASPLGAEPQRRALRGHRPQPAPPAGDTRPFGPFPSRLSYPAAPFQVELKLRGPGRLLGRVAVPRVRDAVAANLQKLKELLER